MFINFWRFICCVSLNLNIFLVEGPSYPCENMFWHNPVCVIKPVILLVRRTFPSSIVRQMSVTSLIFNWHDLELETFLGVLWECWRNSGRINLSFVLYYRNIVDSATNGMTSVILKFHDSKLCQALCECVGLMTLE
jgi:hypothetical protein